MAKKIVLCALALLGLWLAGRGLFRFLASDETKIRWLVEQMESGYNEGKPGTCVGPLAEDWRHEGYELDRKLLLGALFHAARERDRETHQLRSRVALEPGSLVITVDGARATLRAEALFSRLRAGQWQDAWRLSIEAELEDGEDGWEIVRSRHTDLAGTQLGR